MKNNRIAPKFVKNNIYNWISFILTQGGGIIFTVIIARMLSPESFGIYTLALSVVLILMTIADLGINESMVRYISMSIKNKSKIKSYFLYFSKLKIAILFIVSLILLIFSKLISHFYNKEQLYPLLLIGSLYLFIYPIMQFLSSFCFAQNNLRQVVYKDAVFNSLRIFLITLTPLFSFITLSALPLIFAIISAAISILFCAVYIYLNYSFIFKFKSVSIDKKEIHSYTKYLSISSISALLLVYTDIVILGKFVDTGSLGFYRAASSIAILLSTLFSVGSLLYPFLTQLEIKRINSLFKITIRYLLILTIPLMFGTLFLAKYFIRFLFDYSYLPSTIPLYSLLPLIIILPLGDLYRFFINSQGESKITARVVIFTSLLNIFLVILLISIFLNFGAIYATVGAGIAIVLSRFYMLSSLLRYSKEKFGLSFDYNLFIRPLIASGIMSIFLFYFLLEFQGSFTVLLGLLSIIGGIIIYFISLYLIQGISKKDFIYLKAIIREIFGKSKIN
jgi:O-antigen/teichoic acid export membrane protein